LNAISTKSDGDMAAIYYYVMPTSWMQAAWDAIMLPAARTLLLGTSPAVQAAPQPQQVLSENWRVHLGPVGVGKLLNVNPPPPRLFPHAHFRRDFVLVGPNLWLLLREKFGSDAELRLPVTLNDRAESGLAVRASGHQLIELPGSGRFPYEKWFGTNRPGAADEEATYAVEGGGWLTSGSPTFASLAQAGPGNVSDDDDDADSLVRACGTALRMSILVLLNEASHTFFRLVQFPNGDSEPRDDLLASSPVLLLPLSTTYSPVRSVGGGKGSGALRPHGSGLGNLGNTVSVISSAIMERACSSISI
jgi:hypothetical protein